MAFKAIIIVIHYKYDNKKKMNSQNGALGNNDEPIPALNCGTISY